VVVEAAVLVIGDQQQRLCPGRAPRDRVEELDDQLLPGMQIRGRVIVVRAGRPEGEVDEVRVDPGDRGEIAFGGVVEEACVPEDVFLVEVGGDRFLREAILGVDQPEHRHVVVGVPAP
jgi:hypothetical protein